MKRSGTGIFANTKKRKRGSTAGRRKYSKKRGRHAPKNISLTKAIAVTGGVVVVTGLGAAATERLMSGMQDMVDSLGFNMVVTGATLLSAAILLKLAASFVPWFGRKYRAFLRGFGLRP